MTSQIQKKNNLTIVIGYPIYKYPGINNSHTRIIAGSIKRIIAIMKKEIRMTRKKENSYYDNYD